RSGTAPRRGGAGVPRCHPGGVSSQCPVVGSGTAAREEAKEEKEEVSGPTPRRLWKYVTRRLGLRSFLHSPGDGRKYPQIPAKTLLWALLLGQLLRECSFHGIESLVRLSGCRALLVNRTFSDDALGYFTERLHVAPCREALAGVLRRAKRDKAFAKNTFIGLAVDGSTGGRRQQERKAGLW